ncbi:unnamed protein product [Schistosoma margrebowiei]|uniref:Uncharacterized protein n=1 Tax=Schistosoma margrebowiei TaxID=48269 RepID=A0A183MTH7_9TREM|nr:unnamed protein product [Schistosoma margrebowiei]
MKTSKSEEKHGIQRTGWMQLDDLDFGDDLTFLSHAHTRTTSVSEASSSVDLNIHNGKRKILKYYAENINPVTLDGVALEKVESFICPTWIVSSMNKKHSMHT